MSDTLAPVQPAAEPEPPRRSTPLLVAAALLVLAVVGAVMAFGLQRPPALSTVAEAPLPAPTASVAWIAWSAGETCLEVLRPDGSRDRPWCSRSGVELLAWPAAGIEVLDWGGVHERVLTIDPVSGEVLASGADELWWDDDADELWDHDAHDLIVDRRNGELVVTSSGAELWRVAAPDSYDIHGSIRSPDGAWVAATDAAGRLLVLPTDASVAPRVWATGGEGLPVWEGQAQRRGIED
jgi:hypothetical protein